MNKKNYALLFVLALIPFLFQFFRGSLVGFDSYANFGFVCGVGSYVPPYFWGLVLNLFPCNVFLIQLVQFFSLFIVLVCISLIGEKVFGFEGWKLGVYSMGLCPLLFQTSLNFEATWFGFVLGFVGFTGFVLLNKNNKKNIIIKACFLIILLLSCLIWGGNLLLLLALSLYYLPILLISIPIIIFNLQNLINYAINGSILSKYPIAEEMPIIGATPTIFLWPFLNKVPKKWLLTAVFLFIVGMIKVKYMFLAVPFIGMGLMVIDLANKDLKILGKYKWPNLLLLSFCCAIGFGYMGFISDPIQEQLDLVSFGVNTAKLDNVVLLNDWSYGWWVENKGGLTEFKSSYPEPDYNNIDYKFYAITRYYIDKNCTELKSIKEMKLLYCE